MPYQNIGSCLDYGCRNLKILADICLDVSQPGSSCFCQKVQNLSGLGPSLGIVLYPSIVVCLLIKSSAEYENPLQNCTTTSGAFRLRTPVMIVTGCDLTNLSQIDQEVIVLLPCSLTSVMMECPMKPPVTQI